MIRGLIRWANSLHLDALTGFLSGAIPLSLGLWFTAVMNWPLASVALMGIAAAVLIVVYTAPLTLGFTALATRFNLKSTLELFLTLWIVIACFGSIAIFDGLLHIGGYYPVHIFFLSLAIAAGLRSSVVNLDFWMKVIAIFATVLMIVVTIAVIPKHVMTSGVAGPEAVAAADARNKAAQKAADDAQKRCIDALPGNYTSDQAYKACPLKLGTEPAPQAPRKLSSLEQDVFKLNALNKSALDAEATTCLKFLLEIVDGYAKNGTKVVGRSLNDTDYATNEFCSAKSLAVIKKLQKDVERTQAVSSSSGSQVPTIGGEPITVIYFDLADPSTYIPAAIKTLGLHVIITLIIAAFVALLVALRIKKKDSTATITTSKITANTSTGNGRKTLAVIMILGGVGYFAWNNPTISAGVKGGLQGASRAMAAAEIPVWDKFLTKEFVSGHGTKAIVSGVGGEEFDVKIEEKTGLIQLTRNGDEVYGLSSGPCSAPAKMQSEGVIMILSVCSGNWRGGGKGGTYTAMFNPTHNEMYRIAEFRDSSNPRKDTFRMVFR